MDNSTCVKVIAPECCTIKFGDGEYHVSKSLGYTVRGEEIIADLNEAGEIIRLELLGSKETVKPCQGSIEDAVASRPAY